MAHAAAGIALAAGLLGWALPRFAHTTWAAGWQVLSGIPATTALGLMAIMVAGLWLYTFTLTGSLPRLGHLQALVVHGESGGGRTGRRRLRTMPCPAQWGSA